MSSPAKSSTTASNHRNTLSAPLLEPSFAYPPNRWTIARTAGEPPFQICEHCCEGFNILPNFRSDVSLGFLYAHRKRGERKMLGATSIVCMMDLVIAGVSLLFGLGFFAFIAIILTSTVFLLRAMNSSAQFHLHRPN